MREAVAGVASSSSLRCIRLTLSHYAQSPLKSVGKNLLNVFLLMQKKSMVCDGRVIVESIRDIADDVDLYCNELEKNGELGLESLC